MIAPRTRALAAAIGTVLLQVSPAHAEWWTRAPADFEECADRAEKAASKQEKTAALGECNAKFAGRRKPGGGYTYYDFLQNRVFDIAGPNPTAEEQKKIDEAYARYLADQRRANLKEEAAAKELRQQQPQPQPPPQAIRQAALRPEPGNGPMVHIRPKPKTQTADARARAKGSACVKDSFSCEWPRLSEGLNGLKKLFKLQSSNDKKG